ncbi:MAG: YqjF family protein [Actinomycetota bacterium]
MTDSGVSPIAPPLDGPALFDQDWLSLFFLHWAVDPSDVAPFLPVGTRPDVFDGATYVGLVPFRMVDAGPGRGLPTPYLGTFLECNVRLYSVDDEGRHGVVFRSLEATRWFTAMSARWGYRLPYTWARMHVKQRGDRWWWRSDRRYPRGGGYFRLTADVGQPIEPTELEIFYTARWGLHSRLAGRTVWTPNEHKPWSLYAAHVEELHQDLVEKAGFHVPGEPTERALYSPGVHTNFGWPVLVT